MNKIFTIFLVLILMFSSLFSQGRIGTSGATELLIPVHAKGLSLGNSLYSGVYGLEALSYNPSGISYIKNDVEGMFSYMNYIADIGFSYAAIGFNFNEFGNLALSVRNLEFGEIPITTVEEPYGTGDNYSPTFVVAGVTYARNLSENFSAGIAFNYVIEKIAEVSASTVAFDLGFQINNIFSLTGISIGAAIKNLGPSLKFDGPGLLAQPDQSTAVDFIKFDTPEEELPLTIALGVSYSKMITEQYGFRILSSFQGSEYLLNEYNIGGEIFFNRMIYVRGGYSYVAEAEDDPDKNIYGPSFGGGIIFSTAFDITLDYAFRSVDYFSNNHMISLKIGF